MILGVRFLLDVCNVNSFEPTSQLEMSSGDAQTMFFQLVDVSVDRPDQGFSPAGRRYIAPVGSTLSVTFVNVRNSGSCGCGFPQCVHLNGPNSNGPFIRYAAQPFSQDGSIWSVPILSTDPLFGTISLNMQLIEPNRRLNIGMMPGVMLRIR
jgi:hypothetical protein